MQEFKICGRPKQISKQKSLDDDESGKCNNGSDDDQLGTGNSKLPFPGCEDFDARIVEVGFHILGFNHLSRMDSYVPYFENLLRHQGRDQF